MGDELRAAGGCLSVYDPGQLMRSVIDVAYWRPVARCKPVFIDYDYNVDLLCYLTKADLEKIGVSLGHRRKLLAAIAELNGGAATPAQPPTEPNRREAAERREPTPTSPVLAAPLPSASAEAARERRYLTAMFCDLVGSTGIAVKLDTKEWRDLVGAYLDDASAAGGRWTPRSPRN